MNYSGLTVSNKNFLIRFSHLKRFIVAANLLLKYKPRKILDYGSGNGELFKHVKDSLKKNFYFFEPEPSMVNELIINLKKNYKKRLFTKSSKIYKNYFNIIFVNEVFEHLNLKEQKKMLKNLRKISTKDCIFIISVPIEVGISSLFKNLFRIIITKAHAGLNFVNLIKGLFYLKIKRPQKKYNNSHVGFNYLDFIKFLHKENLEIINLSYSPFNFMRGLLNSQIFIEAKFKC